MYEGTLASSMAGIEQTIAYGPYSGTVPAGGALKMSVCSPSPLVDLVSDQPDPVAPVRSRAWATQVMFCVECRSRTKTAIAAHPCVPFRRATGQIALCWLSVRF